AKMRTTVLHRSSTHLLIAAALAVTVGAARAHDESKYPDLSGQWVRVGPGWFDPAKPAGRGQQAPLTPEYQAVFEASLADQAKGGPGNDLSTGCFPTGMPRLMTLTFAVEFVITPGVAHMPFENRLPRSVLTAGRRWP